MERIGSRGPGTGVVEDTPGVDRGESDVRRQTLEHLGRVGRKIWVRRAVPAVVEDACPATRMTESGCAWRIGSDTRDLVVDEQSGGCVGGPCDMPRLADNCAAMETPQQGEESAGAARLEGERGRQLHEQRAEGVAETRDLVEEPRQRLACADQRAVVGDELRDLDGEAEPSRRGIGPPLVDLGRVRTIKRGIDLDGIQSTGVAVELRSLFSEAIAVRAWEIPPGGSDICGQRDSLGLVVGQRTAGRKTQPPWPPTRLLVRGALALDVGQPRRRGLIVLERDHVLFLVVDDLGRDRQRAFAFAIRVQP